MRAGRWGEADGMGVGAGGCIGQHKPYYGVCRKMVFRPSIRERLRSKGELMSKRARKPADGSRQRTRSEAKLTEGHLTGFAPVTALVALA